jgi:hypothetical protein
MYISLRDVGRVEPDMFLLQRPSKHLVYGNEVVLIGRDPPARYALHCHVVPAERNRTKSSETRHKRSLPWLSRRTSWVRCNTQIDPKRLD